MCRRIAISCDSNALAPPFPNPLSFCAPLVYSSLLRRTDCPLVGFILPSSCHHAVEPLEFLPALARGSLMASERLHEAHRPLVEEGLSVISSR